MEMKDWLCADCTDSFFAAAAGPCPDCNKETFAGFKHCSPCALKANRCGACDNSLPQGERGYH